MKVLVAIPSLSRPEYITKKTMSWAKDIEFDTKVFVEPHEKFLYQFYCGHENVVVLPESGRKLQYSLNNIRNYAKENGYDYIFHLDDDVDGFVRVDTDDPIHAFNLTVDDCVRAMQMFPKLGGIRFTQYRFWVYSKKNLFKWTHYNRPLQGVNFLRTSTAPIVDPDFTEFTDTVFSLYLMKSGMFTLNYGLSGLKVVQNANKGGCQVYDRNQDGWHTINKLKKDFPHVGDKPSKNIVGVDVDIDYYLDHFGYEPVNTDDDGLADFLIQKQA